MIMSDLQPYEAKELEKILGPNWFSKLMFPTQPYGPTSSEDLKGQFVRDMQKKLRDEV